MASNILMPALTPTMEGGTISSWLVKEGDTIAPGDVIAEIETDKAVLELEAAEGGVIAKILATEGSEGIKVDAVIAILRQDGDSDTEMELLTKQIPVEQTAQTLPTASPAPTNTDDRIKASPAARHLARNEKIDLAQIDGSGPGNRILKSDVEAAAKTASPSQTSFMPLTDIPFEERPMSGMRKVIARRMQDSKQNVPHLYLAVDIEIDNLLRTRRVFNAACDGWKTTINDFIVRAVAMALREVPAVNVQFTPGKLICFHRADVAVAVAVDGGLVTPVVRGADIKSLLEISQETKRLVETARNGELLPEASQGGTFTVSNVGMYGIKNAQAVINPPQAAIITIGQGTERPVVRSGELTIATMLTATLSCDHRAIDGAASAEFLGTVKRLLEDPERLLDQ